jgi:hypothetical protein
MASRHRLSELLTHQLAAGLGGPTLFPGIGDLGVLALTFQHTSCVRGRPRLRVFNFLSANANVPVADWLYYN